MGRSADAVAFIYFVLVRFCWVFTLFYIFILDVEFDKLPIL